MIHIITAHFGTNKWVDLQLTQIKHHAVNYKIWTCYENCNFSLHHNKFHFCKEFKSKSKFGSRNHSQKLNYLTDVVLSDQSTKNEDILVWMDSDAFPINNLNSFIINKLNHYDFLAINRKENLGEVIPHPSFSCCTIGFFRKYKLNWSGTPPTKEDHASVIAPGGRIYKNFLHKKIEWYQLMKVYSFTDHQVFFSIYDNLIYHHGAGSRKKQCKAGDFGGNWNSDDIYNSIIKNGFYSFFKNDKSQP